MAIGQAIVTDFEAAQLAADTEEFAEVFTTYHSAIYGYVLRMMGNAAEAEDLTITAFEKALRAWGRRPPDLQVRPWLYRIATNTCLDELRRRRIIRWSPLNLMSNAFNHPVAPDNPEDSVLRGEKVQSVRRALAKLPEKYRVALLLRESEGLSCEQIGEALGITRAAAKVLLFRAREKLRNIYESQNPEADL